LIKKGTIIFPNAYSMLHHETKYPDPFVFRPERFFGEKLDDSVNGDPARFAFGFGMR
jgi:cytochrome P450